MNSDNKMTPEKPINPDNPHVTAEILRYARKHMSPAEIETLIHGLDDVWRDVERELVSKDVDSRMEGGGEPQHGKQ